MVHKFASEQTIVKTDYCIYILGTFRILDTFDIVAGTRMSMFKDKDAHLTNTFNQLISDSEDDQSEEEVGKSKLDNTTTSDKDYANESECYDVTSSDKAVKKPKLGSEGEECITLTNDADSNEECIIIDDNDIADKKQDSLEDQLNSTSDSITPNISHSQEDFDFTLHVNLTGTHRQFETTYNTPICDTLRDVLKELKSSNKTLIVTFRNSNISIPLDATPRALNLKQGTILDAIEVSSSLGPSKISSTDTSSPDPDEIKVKLQDGNLRHQREFRTNIHDPLIKLKEAYAKDLNIDPAENIKLYFDGDPIEDEMTPEELGMEDGDAIDVRISS